MRYGYLTLDVFTDRRYGGNPLAVVPEADGLSSEAMQKIAREFNYSETTFVLPPKDPENTAEVRIFTPAYEMPFAGHPNVGTALALALLGRLTPENGEASARFEEKAGLVAMRIRYDGDRPATAELTAPQAFEKGGSIDGAAAAAMLSLPPEAVITDNHRPVQISAGAQFLAIEVAGQDALSAAKADPAAMDAHHPGDPLRRALFFYARDLDGFDTKARMFAPDAGIVEDPATGSANVALVGLLAELDPTPEGTLSYKMAQGYEMGRPSQLTGTAVKKDGALAELRIGGGAIKVMEGELEAPEH